MNRIENNATQHHTSPMRTGWRDSNNDNHGAFDVLPAAHGALGSVNGARVGEKQQASHLQG